MKFHTSFDELSCKALETKFVCSCISYKRHNELVLIALGYAAKASRELVVNFTDDWLYRLIKKAGLLRSPDYLLIRAVNDFHVKTTPIKRS